MGPIQSTNHKVHQTQHINLPANFEGGPQMLILRQAFVIRCKYIYIYTDVCFCDLPFGFLGGV